MVRYFKPLHILIFLLAGTGVIHGQENTEVYSLSEIRFEIDGHTREQAVRNYLNLPDETEDFDNYSSMNTFAENLKQDLMNLRVFESIETELIPLEPEAAGSNPYLLVVRLKDSWTLFPLVVPTFDTNDDLVLKWKINYANVAGTLMELNVDGDFGINRNLDDGSPGINYWKVESTLSNFVYRGIAYSGSWIQGYYRIIEKTGTEMTDFYTFNKSDFILAGTLDLGDHYFYELAPAVELSYSYKDKLPGGSADMETEPQSYGIYQRAGRDQVNWKGNFLTGENWEGYLKSRIVPGHGFKTALFLTNRWFTILSPRMAYSNKITGLITYNDEQFGLGEYMRGVADFNLSGNSGLFVNNTLSLSLFNWSGVMETQIQPFMDFGVANPSKRKLEPQNDMRMSLGTDLVFFPEKITSVNLRFTFGFDLFGPGTFSDRFEMLLSTSLFY